MSYRAPIADIAFTLKHAAGLSADLARGLHGDLGEDLVDAVLGEAGKFANDVIAPLNRVGDTHGAPLKDGRVIMPPGWKEAYDAWTAAGWSALAGPEEWGGQGLPHALGAACTEIWNSASMAFGIGPVLSAGAAEAIAAHASDELKRAFLTKLVCGEWMGTMNLTESQAGSDLSLLRAKAVPAPDGSYRITGQKIFITYGDHELTDNIVHLVLARLPDAPPGTRGISLFLVPKFLVNADGSLGARNDVRCHSVEHKLGIHGSPTCTMVFGDAGGAVGYLVGEENRGLNCMFTMMNNARLAVGLQGVAIAERAYQQALAYAKERRQGRTKGGGGASPIIAHPDVKRMLLTMRALTKAARALCYKTAAAVDRAERETDADARTRAQERASLMTPIAKAFSTDIGMEVASLGVQVHGGMGFIEETGAAQHYRDARIAPIYEGTNGIQAIDLVTRKLPLSGGATLRAYLGELREVVARVAAVNDAGFGATARRLDEAVCALERASGWLIAKLGDEPDAALAGATPYLRLFAYAAGGCALAEEALAAKKSGPGGGAEPEASLHLARFFAENFAVQAQGLELIVVDGAETLTGLATGLDAA